jgi:hypothetical protein
VLADLTPPAGTIVAISFAFDEGVPLVVLIREMDRDRIMRFVLLSLARHPSVTRPPE